MKKTWLEFHEIGDTGKTKIWDVYCRGDFLGQVKWFGPWRQYCFFTLDSQQTVWNTDCLSEVTAFIDKKMLERNN